MRAASSGVGPGETFGSLFFNEFVSAELPQPVVQFGDKVEVLSGWTADRADTAAALDNKLAFWRRNALNP